jgi:flagellar FliL protein
MAKFAGIIIPLVLGLAGLGLGAGAGYMLRPAPDDPTETTDSAPPSTAPVTVETVRLPNQFIVPLINEGRVQAIVVVGLALDLAQGHGLAVHSVEPKLRSIFLQVMFDFAGQGGFSGQFTSGEHLLPLRRLLSEAARAELGPVLHDVLITELVRQDT